MLELTIKEAFNLAGVYDSDSDWERDLKLSAWINRRNWRCVDSPEALAQAREDGVEIIIKKEIFNV